MLLLLGFKVTQVVTTKYYPLSFSLFAEALLINLLQNLTWKEVAMLFMVPNQIFIAIFISMLLAIVMYPTKRMHNHVRFPFPAYIYSFKITARRKFDLSIYAQNKFETPKVATLPLNLIEPSHVLGYVRLCE